MVASPRNNVAYRFVEQAAQRGNAIALRERGTNITYTRLNQLSLMIADRLAGDGVGAGSRVLLFVPMSIDLYATLIAIFRLGAVGVVVDPRAGRQRLADCCATSRPYAFIGVPRAQFLRLTHASLRLINLAYTTGGRLPFTRRLRGPKIGLSVDDVAAVTFEAPALMTFTSGSTGRAKCAVRTHALLLAQHAALESSIGLAPGKTDFATLPIFALANLASGMTTELTGFDAPDIARTVAAPAFFLDHSRRVPDARKLDIYTGGAPLYPSRLERISLDWPNARITALYGSTEAEPIAHMEWNSIAEVDREAMRTGAGLLAGLPVHQVRLAILPNTFGTPIAPMSPAAFTAECLGGEPGEIVVTGEHVLKGYLNGEGDAETKFRVGDEVWHRTGDAGYVDGNGRLWLLGRASARVVDRYGQIYPLQAEAVAYECKAVDRCALVSQDDERALVVEARGDRAAVRLDLLTRLSPFRITRVLFLRRIPVDERHRSKIDYPRLAEMIRRL